jgi:hypothetical protein
MAVSDIQHWWMSDTHVSANLEQQMADKTKTQNKTKEQTRKKRNRIKQRL